MLIAHRNFGTRLICLKKNRHHITCSRACIRKREKENIYFKHVKFLSSTREMRYFISSYPPKIVDSCNFDKSTQPYIVLQYKTNTPLTKITCVCVCVCLCVCVKLTRINRIYFPSANPIIYAPPPSLVYSQNLMKVDQNFLHWRRKSSVFGAIFYITPMQWYVVAFIDIFLYEDCNTTEGTCHHIESRV